MKKITIFIFLMCNYLISDPIKKQDIDQNVVNYYFDNNMQDFFNSIPDQPGVSGDPCVYNDAASTCDWGYVCVKAGDRLSDINNYSEFIGHCTPLNQADNTSIRKQKALILGGYDYPETYRIKNYVKQGGVNCDQCVFNRKETNKVKAGSTCKNGFSCIYAGGAKENGWSEKVGYCVKDGEANTCPIRIKDLFYRDSKAWYYYYNTYYRLLDLIPKDRYGVTGDLCIYNFIASTCDNGYVCVKAGEALSSINNHSEFVGHCTPVNHPDNTSIHKQKALILGGYSGKLKDQIKHDVKQDGTSCDKCVFNRKETNKVKAGSTCKNGYYCIYAGDAKENGWSEKVGYCVKEGEADTCSTE